MTKRQRCEMVFGGAISPDYPPVVPMIYDMGYIAALAGADTRTYRAQGQKQRIDMIESAFLRHDVDGYFVHPGTNDDLRRVDVILDGERDFWLLENTFTGEKFMMNPAGDRFTTDGRPIHMVNDDEENEIRQEADIRRVLPAPPSAEECRRTGYFSVLEHLAKKYPDRHFVFQTGSPFVKIVEKCGYEHAMTMMMLEPQLLHKALDYACETDLARIELGRGFGGGSILHTSYYTGTDSISPECYREFVAPYDRRICERAHELGLYTLYWFLGDMRGIVDDIAALPIDAIAPEQPRKGYGPDMPALRCAMGERRCVMSYTFENEFITRDTAAIRRTWEEQYALCRSGPMAAGVTIMPGEADPRSMDDYVGFVHESGR